MSENTITLFQYNQRQARKNQAVTPKHRTFDETNSQIVTRKVLGREGMTQILVPSDLSPGLATRLADMLKWNIECDGKYHQGEKKYETGDFDRAVWSLACLDDADLDLLRVA